MGKTARALVLGALLVPVAGCGAIAGLLDSSYRDKLYVGGRWHVDACREYDLNSGTGRFAGLPPGHGAAIAVILVVGAWAADVLASLAVDTVLLPLTATGVIGERDAEPRDP